MSATVSPSGKIRASTIGRLPPHLAVAVCESSHSRAVSSESSVNDTSTTAELSLNANEAGELILDDEEYARRKLDWVERYTKVETLRKTFGTNRNILWGDLYPSETRKLYHTLLPQALMGLYDNGLMRPHELAPLAYEARKAAKKYARERSIVPVRMAAMAFDGYRSCRDYGRWSHHGLSWDQVWTKYESKIVDDIDNEEDGDEMARQICLRILESSCRTNTAINKLVLRDNGGEDVAEARRKTKKQQDMEMAAISAQLDSDIHELLVEGAQKSVFFQPTMEQKTRIKNEKSRRVSQLVSQIQPARKNYKFEGEEQTGLSRQEFFLLRIMTGDKIGSVRVQDLLEWLRSEDEESTGPDDTLEVQRLRRAKKARVALTVGKMYQDLGMSRNCLAVYEEALLLWKSEEYHNSDPIQRKELVGGYTNKEIEAFHESDIYFIIQLSIERSKVYATTIVNDKNVSADPTSPTIYRCIVDAWDVYKRLLELNKIHDRSMVFPLFSCLFMYLKTGHAEKKIFSDSFQDEYVSFFLQEAQVHGDPIHHARALAIQAEIYAQRGQFESALLSFQKIVPIYDAEKHHEGVCKAYGTDRVAQSFSLSATWELYLHREESAREKCEYVIHELLPKMDPKNVHSNFCLLYPVMRIFKDDDDGGAARMRNLLAKHVVANFEEHFSAEDAVTPCLVIFKPLLLLLEIYDKKDKFAWRDDLHEVIEWAANDSNGVAPDILDAAVMNFGWNHHTITAELCVRLSEFTHDEKLKKKLLSKAQDLCLRARKNHQNLTYPVAFDANERVLALIDPRIRNGTSQSQ